MFIIVWSLQDHCDRWEAVQTVQGLLILQQKKVV